MNLAIKKQLLPNPKSFGWILICCLLGHTSVAQNVTETLTIRNVESINSKTLEYAPLIYGDQLVFTSTRPTAGSPMTKWRDEKNQFSDLYVADKSNYSGFINVRRLPGKASSPVHDGVATFNKEGTELFFTRSNKNGKNANNVINLKIYSAQLVNNVWQNMQELPFNDEHFSNCHPSLSQDGSQLIFASNRPGGFGGMDLYRSKNINGVWQHPENLGPTINSSSNELFPFLAANGTLYFSSDNENSLGGMDIFKAEPTEEQNKFAVAQNLGVDFNSPADDFGFCETVDRKEGYFASNRKGGKGGDDIYHWAWKDVILPPDQLSISIYDAQDNKRLSNALVTIFDDGVTTTKNDIYPIAKMMSITDTPAENPYKKLEKKNYQTGSRGKISMILEEEKSYTIFIEKEGYLPLKKVLTTEELTNKKQWDLVLERKAGIPLRIKAINMPFREPAAFVTLELLNKSTQKIERAISDEMGNFTFHLTCGCDYELTGEKSAYRKYQKQFTTKYRNCGNLNAINTELYMIEQNVIAEISNTKNKRFHSLAQYQQQGLHKIGETVHLNRMTFSENKADLLPQTINELNQVYQFLQSYPNISVELAVHTDARGTAKFNHRLARKRADIIAQFLLEKGTPKEQISTIGYGEDKLLNHCSDGIRCSEEEHLQNKRVEMKITQIDRLKVEHLIGQR